MLKTILVILTMSNAANAAYLKLYDVKTNKVYTRLPTYSSAYKGKSTLFRIENIDCNFLADGPGNSTTTVSCDGGEAIMGVSLDCDWETIIKTKNLTTAVKLVCEEI